MLKRLKLNAELKQRKAELDSIMTQKTDFEKRKADLEGSLEEAKTEDDIKLVTGEIEALEKEVSEAGIEGKETSVRGEIDRIEKELSALDENAPPIADVPAEKPAEKNETRGGNFKMKLSKNMKRIILMLGMLVLLGALSLFAWGITEMLTRDPLHGVGISAATQSPAWSAETARPLGAATH